MRLVLMFSCILLGFMSARAGLVEDYISIPGEQQYSEVSVKVDGQPVFVHQHVTGNMGYVHFSFTGQIRIEVTAAAGVAMLDGVRPRPLNIASTRNGNTQSFTIDKPFNYVIKRNDFDVLLAIFAEAPMADIPVVNGTTVRTAASFGITTGNSALQTQKINDAISTISGSGGGTLFFERGVYNSSTIFMKNNVQIWLDAGTKIMASGSWSDYPQLPNKPAGTWANAAFVYWDHTVNAKIRGHGILDANGQSLKLPFPQTTERDGRHQFFSSARNSVIEGVRIMNSTNWTIHPVDCDTILFKNVHVMNQAACCWVDQFDIDGCRYVTLENCFTYGGDDGFCIKSQSSVKRAITDITVRNTSIYSTSSNGFRLGANASEGNWSSCRNVLWENVHILRAGEGGFRFQLCGSANNENWRFSNCFVESNAGYAIDLGNTSWSGNCSTPAPVTNNITWENLDLYGRTDIVIQDATNVTLKCIRVNGVVRTGAGYTGCQSTVAKPAPAVSAPLLSGLTFQGSRFLINGRDTWSVRIISSSGAVVKRIGGKGPALIDMKGVGMSAGIYIANIESIGTSAFSGKRVSQTFVVGN